MAQALMLASDVEPFPGYRLTKFLGRGGWGEVWKATRHDGHETALKFLPTQAQDVAVQEIRALQAIRQLNHRHLIAIEQIWCLSGYLVIAMEMAEGSLLDLLEVYQEEYGTPIFPEHVCYYLSQAAAGLDFLNARQHQVNGQRVAFRHCDIKPSNLLVQGNTVKVADFSLATTTTSPMWYNRRVGTPNYAAPEVFKGWLSEWTDQYALAVTYCQLRTGRLPFPSTPDILANGYVRPAPDLSMLYRGERPLIARALDPVPQNRWPSCTELIERLQQVLGKACAAVS